jgi:hypothetical protein
MIRIYLTIVISAFVTVNIMAQNFAQALAAADTINFSVNKKEGWMLYNSCLTLQKSDSILIELILQHDRNINWEAEQEVGRIRSDSFYPKYEQTVTFNLLFNIYKLRIDKNGKCYLYLAQGSLPDESDQVIIPVRAFYKK